MLATWSNTRSTCRLRLRSRLRITFGSCVRFNLLLSINSRRTVELSGLHLLGNMHVCSSLFRLLLDRLLFLLFVPFISRIFITKESREKPFLFWLLFF
jgi:hypothetical protein